ncbi:MAG: type IV toxin-antitoxin system AbiEi family antitoxin domain-containing protein [Candidatus Tectomicrobia bacterium]|nr:type IV toxin-antitoxin system AbiEi family antitoxin domain-containing protein [Candidatus Tectomicrobia bacterium]
MAKPTLTQDQLYEAGIGAFFRPQDLDVLGIPFYDLQQLVAEGVAERVARGLYRLTDAEPSEHYSLAAVCARAPNAIVCLLSALRYHDIGTQLPRDIWIAIPRRSRAPRVEGFPIRLVRFSGPSLSYGVEEIRLENVPVKLTTPARTVVDCFRFRRLVGRDVALEALRTAIQEHKASADEIWRAAEVCRAKSLVGPALEVLAL